MRYSHWILGKLRKMQCVMEKLTIANRLGLSLRVVQQR